MTEVAHVNDPQHAPSVIRQLLEKLAISYNEVMDNKSLPPARKVQAVLVEDAVGALLILFPQSQLLDLSRITELTGRQLTAVPHDRLQRMLTKHNLQVLPGLPALTSSPCLYDDRLLQEPTLLVGSGEKGLVLEISSDDFKGMLSKASAAHFGQSVAAIRPNLDRPDDDPAEITQAMHVFTARRIQQRL
ncbi:YbaK/EbsC family protein, partial [Pseudomonas savastanoi]